MRIERDAVGPLDAAQQRPALVAQREQAAIGAVDMEPGAVARADFGDLLERVDRAGVDRPGRGDDQPGTDAVGGVARHRLRREPRPTCGGGRRSRSAAAARSRARRCAAPCRCNNGRISSGRPRRRRPGRGHRARRRWRSDWRCFRPRSACRRRPWGSRRLRRARRCRHSRAAPRRGWPTRSPNICSTPPRGNRRSPNGTARRPGYRP